MIAFLEAYRTGLLQRQHWLPNIISGVIVGVVALPLAMAFAIASGAKPEQGIYTAIVAGALVSLLGGSRLQIAGPTGAFIVILSGITAKYGIDGLQIATLMAGVILFFLGVARFGTVIKYIPQPVIVGFTAGIAVIIWVGQWKDFFGLPAVGGGHFHEKFLHLLQVLPQLNTTTTALSLISLALVLYSYKLPGLSRVPGPLVALVVATVVQAIFHFDGVATIGSTFGGIPQGLPGFHLPEITVDRLMELMGPAFAIAMLGAIESLLSAVVADGMAGTRHNSNQELIGQGIANIAAPLFGGFAATGAIARTATNIRNGGNSPLAGIVHAIILLTIIIFLAPLAVNIPLCVLAAILFVVAWNMSEARHFLKMIKCAPRADVMILLTTFVLTIAVDLVMAVYVGVILAAFQFLRRMASSVAVQRVSNLDLQEELVNPKSVGLNEDILIYMIEGPLFFGAVEKLEHALAITHTEPKILIIRLARVPFMDITGLQTLEEVILSLQKHQVHVMLTEANARIYSELEKTGIVDLVKRENIFQDFAQALKMSSEQLTRTTARVGEELKSFG